MIKCNKMMAINNLTVNETLREVLIYRTKYRFKHQQKIVGS
jgi:hypothetical protein